MPVSYFSGARINERANNIIQHILSLMPPDVDELERLKNRLTQTRAQFPSLSCRRRQQAQSNAAITHKVKIQPIVDLFEGSPGRYEAEPMLQRIREGDDVFFKRNRDYYLNCWATSIDTIESGLPYSETCTTLGELSRRWARGARDNPDATITSLRNPLTAGICPSLIRRQTGVNALKTVIDLFIVKPRTGQLPDTLAADSAPDLFSGKPIKYSKKPDGVILCCRVTPSPYKDLHEYEFKVK